MSCLDLWSDANAKKAIIKYKDEGINEDLAIRTYSARLLGSDPELVLHGGGNTSVKTITQNIFGEIVPVLCVKGSGWDLETIEPEGHPAIDLEALKALRKIATLSDEEMVSIQRSNLINPNSPNPSVETLLHAFLPHKFVDHTHSIALLALADQPDAEVVCRKIYGDRVVIVPYVMPGFDLAKAAANAYELATKDNKKDNSEIEGMILLKHGLFSFGKSGKESYKRMIGLVKEAEKALPTKIELNLKSKKVYIDNNSSAEIYLPFIRGLIGRVASKYGYSNKWIFEIRSNKEIVEFINSSNLKELAKRGVATPDHVIRTKVRPWVIDSIEQTIKSKGQSNQIKNWFLSLEISLKQYVKEYIEYFESNNKRFNGNKKQLDPIPRLIAFPGIGLIGIGRTKKAASIAADIGQVWLTTIRSAESLGEYRPVNSSDCFDLEYWSLEQAKLGKSKEKSLAGNIVLVTGAGGIIGSSIAKEFSRQGAEIVALDINGDAAQQTAKACGKYAFSIQCDLTVPSEVKEAFKLIKLNFGGIDIIVSNAGSALPGNISSMEQSILDRSIAINLYSHNYVAQQAVKIFKEQDYSEEEKQYIIGGQILFNISKQAINPGPGFGSYGISKSALLSLMKQYAIEEGEFKIRCNGINADRIRSGLLNDQMIRSRSIARGLSEEEYMQGNLLKTEVKAEDVAKAFVALSKMSKTTGALITIDGGNPAAMVR